MDTEPNDHALGRSRGGLSTKLHLACEQGQRPLSMLVTAGQSGDSPQFGAILAGIRVPRPGCGRARARPDRVLADKAYSSRANRAELRVDPRNTLFLLPAIVRDGRRHRRPWRVLLRDLIGASGYAAIVVDGRVVSDGGRPAPEDALRLIRRAVTTAPASSAV